MKTTDAPFAGPYSGHTVLDAAYTSKHAEVLTDRSTQGLPADERQLAMLRTRELVRVVQSHQRELIAACADLNTWLAKLKRSQVVEEDDGG